MFQSFRPKLKMSVSHGKSSKPASCQPWNPWAVKETNHRRFFVLRKIGERKNFEFQAPETNLVGKLPTCF